MPDTSLLPMPTDWQCGLAIAAHPDDLEYGAAGAIAAWTSEGREVAYLLVTRGEAGIDGMAPDRAGPLRESPADASTPFPAVWIQTALIGSRITAVCLQTAETGREYLRVRPG